MMNDAGMHAARESSWNRRIAALAMILGFATGLVDSRAGAQEEDESDPWSDVEQMIVVGTGGYGGLTEATVSVTSFDSIELQAIGASDVSDVAKFTPNLEIRTAGSTAATFFIRGVGLNDFAANASGSVAVYVDDGPKNLPAIQLGQLFDLEGVEVEKGPQGSGPGRNASAGAIRIYTKKPTGEFGGFLRMDYGNYDFIDAEGALETPVYEDMLAIRSAFRLTKREGIVTNRCAGFTQAQIDASNGILCGARSASSGVRAGLQKNLNNQDKWAARSTLRFVPPIEEMEWNFTGTGSRLDQTGTVGQQIGALGTYGSSDRLGYLQQEVGAEASAIADSLNIPTRRDCRNSPNPQACQAERDRLTALSRDLLSQSLGERPLDSLPFEGDYNNPGYERQTTWGLLLRGEWEVGGVQLVSVSAFDRYDRERLIDADYSPNIFFEFDIEDDAWQFSQDLRASGEIEALPISWRSGVFYLQEELDYEQDTLARNPLTPFRQDYTQKTSSLGVFAEFTWELLDSVILEAGARYNWERKEFEAEITRGLNPGTSQCEPVGGVTPPCTRTVTVDQPTGSITLRYIFDESRSFYMKYSHGWKGSQFNVRDGTIASLVTDVADPETIDAFELGFSGSWLDDRILLEGAIFAYEYENYQVFTFTNDAGTVPQRVVLNANDAQIYGAELEGTFLPIEPLKLNVRFGWLESKFLDFSNSVLRPLEGRPGQFFRQPLDFSGNSLPNAPRFKVSGSVEYTLEIGRFGTLIPRYDFTWTDDINFDQTNGRGAPNSGGEIFLPRNAIGQDALLLQNFRLTYELPGSSIKIAGWVRNLTNEVYKTLAFDASGGPAFVGNILGDPRTYGLSASFEY